MFKTNFLGATKFWGEQKKFRGALPRMPPRGYGPEDRHSAFHSTYSKTMSGIKLNPSVSIGSL